ncbi:MAG: NAD(+)/NADH kinase [Anaerolineales bacterium]|nr:NAD(+)/NADH kinase [Anaerolineales bacterium]
MDIKRIGILCNPFAGSGKARVLELTQQAFDCLEPQVSEIFVGPGDMGETVCKGKKVKVVGQDNTKTRIDTINTAKQMIENGVELFVIVAGDGTYNDALEGMKTVDANVPIFGIAGGRFNVIFPKRVHDPFVSLRGDFKSFSIKDLEVEEVRGLVTRINDKIVSYGFFWVNMSNVIAHTDTNGALAMIDAAQYIDGKIIPIAEIKPVATEDTRVAVHSNIIGEIELARGADVYMPIVAHIVPELNQIMAGGFGAISEAMGFQGVTYCFPGAKFAFFPTPDTFPNTARSIAFFAGDQVRFTNMKDGSVLCVDSSAITTVKSTDVITVEVVLELGKKAILKRS